MAIVLLVEGQGSLKADGLCAFRAHLWSFVFYGALCSMISDESARASAVEGGRYGIKLLAMMAVVAAK